MLEGFLLAMPTSVLQSNEQTSGLSRVSLCSALQRGLGSHKETNADANGCYHQLTFSMTSLSNNHNICHEVSLWDPMAASLRCGEQKPQCEPPTVFTSSALSVPHGLHRARPSVPSLHESSYSLGRGGKGGGRSVRAGQISSHQASQWPSCAAISTFIPLLSPSSFFPPLPLLITSLWANQQQEEQGCAPLSLSVWHVAGSVRVPWLALTLHQVSEKPALRSLFQSAHFYVCIHEMQIRYSRPSYTHCEQHILCLYFDVNGRQLFTGKSVSEAVCSGWRCSRFIIPKLNSSHVCGISRGQLMFPINFLRGFLFPRFQQLGPFVFVHGWVDL